VQAVYARAGIKIGRTTYTQVKQGQPVDRGSISPGDLIFMNFSGEKSPGHVGIYVGNGKMVHDHGARGGVELEGVPWGSVVDTRTYSTHGGPKVTVGPTDTTTTPPTGGGGGGGLTVGTKKRTVGATSLPTPIETAITRAERTKTPFDDLKALDKAIDWVQGQLARKDLSKKKRLELEKLLTKLENERAGAETEAEGKTVKHKFKPTTVFGAITAAFGAYQGGTHLVTAKGTPFGTIKYQAPNEAPQDVAGWKKVQNDIAAAAKKIRAQLTKAQKRLKKLRKALKRADRSRHKNPRIIHKLRQHISDTLGEIEELKDELKSLREDYIVAQEAIAALLGQELAAGDLPPELELKAVEAEGTEDLVDDLSVLQEEKAYFEGQLAKATTPQAKETIQARLNQINQQIKDLLGTAKDSREAELLNLPATIRLAIAQSALTPDTADDLQALKAAEAFYSSSLSDPNLNIETRIQLTDLLASIRAQIADLTGAKADAYSGTIEAYLSAVRDLRQYRGNIFDFPSPTAGAAVNVTNNYLTQPEDPHLWSNAVLFDLRAGMS
jgi:hypothetical protein